MTNNGKLSPRFTKAYSPWVPSRARKPRSVSPDWGPVVTKQEMKKEVDINNIIKKYKDTGVVQHVNALQGSFGDFTHAMDYQSSLNKVKQAQDSFAALPANIRKRFKNNPAALVAFVEDPKNKREAAYLGLLKPEATKGVLQADKAARQARQNAKDKEIAQLKESLAKAQKT